MRFNPLHFPCTNGVRCRWAIPTWRCPPRRKPKLKGVNLLMTPVNADTNIAYTFQRLICPAGYSPLQCVALCPKRSLWPSTRPTLNGCERLHQHHDCDTQRTTRFPHIKRYHDGKSVRSANWIRWVCGRPLAGSPWWPKPPTEQTAKHL